MGFDIVGRKPKNKKGTYFRSSSSCWIGLAYFILSACDDCLEHREKISWYANDGQKVTAKSSLRIADRLDILLDTGIVYQREKAMWGKKFLLHEVQMKSENKGDLLGSVEMQKKCKKCNPTKQNHYFEDDLVFCRERVSEFSKFCRNSGGFEID